jgi:hypothetical protein
MVFCVAVFREDFYYYLPKHAAKIIMYMATNKKVKLVAKNYIFYIISRVYAQITDVNCFEMFGNACLKIHNVMGQKEMHMEFIRVKRSFSTIRLVGKWDIQR